MNAQEKSMASLESQGFRFINWIPAQPSADGDAMTAEQTAVMAKRIGSHGREYREVEPDGSIN